jgi:hypothetical protein
MRRIDQELKYATLTVLNVVKGQDGVRTSRVFIHDLTASSQTFIGGDVA